MMLILGASDRPRLRWKCVMVPVADRLKVVLLCLLMVTLQLSEVRCLRMLLMVAFATFLCTGLTRALLALLWGEFCGSVGVRLWTVKAQSVCSMKNRVTV